MSTTPAGFKHNLFGGFRQTDVTQYIKRLAQQRNEYREQARALEEQNEALLEQNEQLSDQVAALQEQLAEEDHRRQEAQHAQLLTRVHKTLAQASASLSALREELDSARASLYDASSWSQETMQEIAAVLTALVADMEALGQDASDSDGQEPAEETDEAECV